MISSISLILRPMNIILAILIWLSFGFYLSGNSPENAENTDRSVASCLQYEESVIHHTIGDTALNENAIKWAFRSYLHLKNENRLTNDTIITIVDFSQPSQNKRAYIYDLKNQQLLYQKRVAHGMKTGEVYAENFSNRSGSHQSSFGAYVTTSTYHGKFDLALRLVGIEYCNNKASDRGIVIHAADYATEEFLQENGRLGRSFGCPAFPHEDFTEIIDLIKEGSCFYIFYQDHSYEKKSFMIRYGENWNL